jgi:hypothetical protein
MALAHTDIRINPPRYINVLNGSSAPANDFTPPTGVYIQAISFVTAGAIVVTDSAGNTSTIPSGALAAGIQHAMEITKITASGTTAAGIVVYGEKRPGV